MTGDELRAPGAGGLVLAAREESFDAADAIGTLAVRLGLREDGDGVAAHARRVVREPLELFARHVHWPAPLNDQGAPLELSLKLDGQGGTSLRWVTDVTDHRTGVLGNWSRYLDVCTLVAGCRDSAQRTTVRELCRTHLDGIPPEFPSRLVVGGGYAAPDRTRGTLYFRTGWMSPPVLAARLGGALTAMAEVRRAHGGVGAEGVEVMAYDFTDGGLDRWKAYSWLPVRPDRPFAQVGGRHPDLVAAGHLYESFAERVPAPAREHALFVQTVPSAGEVRQRLFFFADLWGWSEPPVLAELLGTLVRLGVDVRPLMSFRGVLGDLGLRLRLSMVAVGGGEGTPSVTFYFLPSPHPGAGGARAEEAEPASRVRGILAEAVRGLLAAREVDGSWRDPGPGGGGGLSDQFVTASVAAVLVRQAGSLPELAASGDWLAREVSPTSDRQVLGWASAVLSALGRPVPAEWTEALCSVVGDGGRGPDEVAAAVGALSRRAAGGPDLSTVVEQGIDRLLRAQRADGSWAADRWVDDGATTAHVLRALAAPPPDLATDLRAGLDSSRTRASGWLARTPVSREPAAVGSWLRGWLLAGGSARHPSIGRALSALDSGRRDVGSWSGAPVVPCPGDVGGSRIDGGLLTTATVVDGLHLLGLGLAGRPSR